jgi:outer membrane protein OmpA-like peptidoglycan-associated protein
VKKLNIKNYLIGSMVLSLSYLSFAAHADDEPYIEVPQATQIADLLDEDSDGVINARDLCPQTPRSAEIDNDGCGTFIKSEETLSLHILFANNSSDIQPIFLTQVREMANFLKTYPSTSIELKGYASKVGNAEHNMALSQQRSMSVMKAIQNNGITRDRIRIIGFGDTQLGDSGDSQIAHAKNRKVVATVVGHKGSVKEEWTIFTKIPK